MTITPLSAVATPAQRQSDASKPVSGPDGRGTVSAALMAIRTLLRGWSK